jgi:hypothetical protein
VTMGGERTASQWMNQTRGYYDLDLRGFRCRQQELGHPVKAELRGPGLRPAGRQASMIRRELESESEPMIERSRSKS